MSAAAAQGPGLSLRLDPNLVGRPSTLKVEAGGQSGQTDGRVPQSVVLSVQRGFKLDLRARRARCSPRQAQDFACPKPSRIGGGRAVVTASSQFIPGGSQAFTASIDLFLAPRVRRGDVAGLVVTVEEPTTGQRATATGRLVRLPSGPFGYELRFDRFPTGPAPPPGVTIELNHLYLHAGASRTVTHSGRRVTYHLITNPSQCDGTWDGRAVVRFTDGTSQEMDLAAPCRSQ